MALQVDQGGGEVLRRKIEELDVTVHTTVPRRSGSTPTGMAGLAP